MVGDVTAWYGWCAGIDLPPLAARRHHVDRWIAEQLEHPQPGTGRPASAATVTRRLSCLAGLYEYAVVDAGLLEASPVVRVKRGSRKIRTAVGANDDLEILSADWWCRRGLRRRARYLIGRLRGEVCKALAGGPSAAVYGRWSCRWIS